jgi:hypothetical protein
MTAKERTAWWIRHQPPSDRYSPSAPPSEQEGDPQRFTVFESDAESTHSVPLKMTLKCGDCRHDIPISHWNYEHNKEPLSHSGSTEEFNSSWSTKSHRQLRSEQPVQQTGPFPATQCGLASINENAMSGSQRDARPTRRHVGAHLDDSRSPSRSSQDSGSTYYVLPTPGQVVQVIVSLHTTFNIFFVNPAVFGPDFR